MKRAWITLIPVVAAASCATQRPSPNSDLLTKLPEVRTPAVRDALRLHASRVESVAESARAGIWVVQDKSGRLVSSGVLNPFPTQISSEDYEKVVPGSKGLDVEAFGFGRTERRRGHGPLRVVYVTVSARR